MILVELVSRRKELKDEDVNKFRDVIAAVMLPRDFFRKSEEKKYIYAGITCKPWRKGADYRG